MKILVLGNGVSTKGVERILNDFKFDYDILELSEVKRYDYDLVIKSPGIKYSEKVIKDFEYMKIKVITDIELVYMLYNHFFVGITGSNGKTTTTELVTKIINKRLSAIACGNIGYSVSDAILDNKEADLFVCELSSFQLEGCLTFHPKISVMLNISPCHLDHHGSFYNYFQAKKKLVTRQTTDEHLVYYYDDINLRKLAKNLEINKYSFSLDSKLADCYEYNGYIYFKKEKIIKTNKIKILGKHNLLNAMAAICVGKILNIDTKDIKEVLLTFEGVKYRMQKKSDYLYNDAKSTNIYSTMAAITNFNEVNLICGGYDRKDNIDNLYDVLNRIKKVYVYGESKNKIKEFFLKHQIEVKEFDTLKEATLCSLNERLDEYILFSPMCASYDQYESYIQRGEDFDNIVEGYLKQKAD